MKKIVFIIAIAATFSVAGVHAQSSGFGVKGGVNFASLNGDDIKNAETRTSFHVGGVYEIKISNAFSVQPEFLYSSQGYKGEGDFQFQANYLNVPLMGKFYVAKGLSLQAGPQVGLLIYAHEKSVLLGVELDNDVKDNYKDIDYGVNFGLGYTLPSGLFFDARYNLGLSAIDAGEADIKNNVIQLSLGFLF